jgi:hypothetical protein
LEVVSGFGLHIPIIGVTRTKTKIFLTKSGDIKKEGKTHITFHPLSYSVT